jgi:CubicO group peptidase (beta-lactamase class C family)
MRVPVRIAVVALATLTVACTGRDATTGAAASSDAMIARVAGALRPGLVVKGRPERSFPLAGRMERYHVPGVSIAVADSGRIVWARGFGVKEAGTSDSVTVSTLFQAASISKPVAATGMLRLVEDGRLSLDEPVNAYLTSWQLPENQFTRTAAVTLRRIVSHSAGLTVHGFPGYAAGETLPTVPQILDGEPPANTAPVRVDTLPGTLGRYSGGGVTVEQLAMADVTGEPFPALMKRLVLDPAGMAGSTYEQPLPDARRSEAAAGHRTDGARVEGRWHTYPEMAAAGLWTTPTDLLKWALAIAGARAGEHDGVLSRSMATDMLTPQFAGFGLGPSLGGEGEGFHFGHGGANEGFRCELIYFPELGRGAAVMTNGDGGGALTREILLSIAAEYGWPDYGPSEIDALPMDSTDLEAFVGAFGVDAPPVTLVLTREGAALYAASPGNLGKEEIVFTAADRAIGLSSGITLSFVVGANGRADEVRAVGLTLTRR